MCGRFVREGDSSKVKKFFRISKGEENWTASFNVAPTTATPVIVSSEVAGRFMDHAIWDFKPPFPKGSNAPLVNARGETVHSLPSFREAFKSHRCLIPASGYYEWRRSDKQPFYFQRRDSQPLAMAGIYESLGGKGMSACLITTTPNSDIGSIHDRMPVILNPDSWDLWLSSKQLSEDERVSLLVPSSRDTLVGWPVNRSVGNVRNDHPSLIEPIKESPKETTLDLFQ